MAIGFLAVILAYCILPLSVLSSNNEDCPLVLGHRGAAGIYPEHTAIAYEMAAKNWADYIECDVQVTKDLQLVCSHEAWIEEVCNIDDFPEFQDRRRTYNMDDDDPTFDWNDKGNKTDFFTFDFNLTELKMLKRRQRTAGRDPNFDWQYSFATFDEFVAIAQKYDTAITPEIKTPTAVNRILKSRNINVTVQDLLLQALQKHGYTREDDKCLLQSFELTTIENLKGKTDLKRLFLLKRVKKTDTATLERVQRSGAYAICLDKELIVTTQSSTDEKPGYIGEVNQKLVDKIHYLGMKVYAYTFLNEMQSLKWDYQADPRNELRNFKDEIGLDAYFTDFPNTARNFLDEDDKCQRSSASSIATSSLSILIFLLTMKIQ